MQTLQAIGNKVIIKKEKMRSEKRNSGIYMPTIAFAQEPIGTVISVGEKVLSVKVGDRVMYKQWEKIECKFENEMYYVFEDKPEHLLAIMTV